MAYITKEQVKDKSKALALLNKMYGVKATFSGSNSITLTLTISSGKIDFIKNALNLRNANPSDMYTDSIRSTYCKGYLQANHYYLECSFDGVALEYLQQAYAIMKAGHWDDSDIQTDYFSCSWYNAILIGKWDKPFAVK